jgi:hypothetical protein
MPKSKSKPIFLKVGGELIDSARVKSIDVSDLANHRATIHLYNGAVHHCEGFDAIEAVYALRPSVLEGVPQIKWKKGAWAFHNIVGHPVMQILAWMGMTRRAIWFHDVTTPKLRSLRSPAPPE